MILREIQVSADVDSVEGIGGGFYASFNRNVLCISIPYNHFIYRAVRTDEVDKLFAELTTNEKLVESSTNDFRPMKIWHFFDFQEYIKSTSVNKKEMLLAAVHSIALNAAANYAWDTTPFDEAASQIRESNYCVKVLSKRQWIHPNRKFSMRVECEFDLDIFRLTAIFYRVRPRKELKRFPLGEALPTANSLRSYLSDAQWITPDTFSLDAKYSFRNENWKCTVDTADFDSAG